MSGDILSAASTGDIEAIRRCLQDGCDVNSVNEDGDTSLHKAAGGGYIDIIKTLIQFGADVEVKNRVWDTPLHKAAEKGHNDIVETLIQAGAGIYVEDLDWDTPLHKAAEGGHNDIGKTLIQFGAEINVKNKNGNTPLHKAAEGGHNDIGKTLIQFGANINVKNKNWDTPLHKAAEGGHNDIGKTLIQFGANINVKNKEWATPLYKAAGGGHIDVVGTLIRTGAEIHVGNRDGDSPLHNAAEKGHNDVVKTLIQAGPDVNVKNKIWNTPLHYATKMGRNDVTTTLIKAGADANVKNKNASTPLHWAAIEGHNDVVKTLLQAGADFNAKNFIKNIPLHWAAEKGHDDVVRTLIMAGADFSVKNLFGNTTIDVANPRTKECIKKILEEHENPMKKVPKEIRVLGHWAIAKYLHALKEDSAVSNVIRVMLVGHFGVGKTTIAMNLLERQTKHIDSTDGIEVYINQCMYDTERGKWYTEIKYNDTLRGFDGVIRLDIVDFAGQLIFYTTHQTYLTSRGLYLLVFNLAMGLQTNVDDEDLYPGKSPKSVIDFLEYWIGTIITYARAEQVAFPKVILVGTHRDEVEDESALLQIKEEIVGKFDSMINSTQLVVRDDLFISATNMRDETRKCIRDIILEEGMKYKEFGEHIPASWVALQEELMKLKQEKQYIVTIEEIKKINREMNSPLDEEALDVFLKYLHNIGYILYFSTSVLKEKVILDPKVVIDAMKSFITCKRFIKHFSIRKIWKQMRESGEVKKSHIIKMWKGKGLAEHSEHLLAIMKRLDLICEPKIYRFGQKLSLDFFVVPSMISATTPEAPVIQVPDDARVVLVFSSEAILPPAIFNRLVCSCLALWTVFNKHLYNGLVVLRSGRFHLIEMRRQMNKVVVTFVRTDATTRPDIKFCMAIKQFLAETIDQIVAVYCTSENGPVTCDSARLETFLNDGNPGSGRYEDEGHIGCSCEGRGADINRKLEDVNLMRIAEQLQKVDLRKICAVILNDAEFSDQIEINYESYNADVKVFYALQEWKRRQTRYVSVTDLLNLFENHMEHVNKHIICQAMREDVFNIDNMDATVLVSKVYPEFLDAVADQISYKYLHLGLELGFTLREIERLRLEKKKIIEITRELLEKWHSSHEDDATVSVLVCAFHRCGERNLKWVESEFDVGKIINRGDASHSEPGNRKCSIS